VVVAEVRQRTFESAELVERFEPGGVVGVVRLERNSEEVAVGRDVVLDDRRLGSTHPTHLAVHQLHVEVGKLDVVALRVFAATAPPAAPRSK